MAYTLQWSGDESIYVCIWSCTRSANLVDYFYTIYLNVLLDTYLAHCMNHGVMACEDVEVKDIVQCSILKSSTHVKCHFGRRKSFLFWGALHKNVLYKVSTLHASRKTTHHKIQSLQFANINITRLQYGHSSKHFQISITLVISTLRLRRGKLHLYVNVEFLDRIGWRVIAEVDWNLKHWMHWYECHYVVFRWNTWIGLEFLTVGNRPKTIRLCLWSWMTIKCIM